jgi:hypothetical protein
LIVRNVTLALGMLLGTLALVSRAQAQFDEPAADGALGEAQRSRYQVGVRISAGGSPCRGIVATIPVLADWPEQTIVVDEELVSDGVQTRFRMLDGGVKQMLVSIPQLPAGQTAEALLTYEVTRHAILPPVDPTIFVIPKRPPPAVRKALGHSPYIESRHGKIRALAKEILAEHKDANAFDQVKAIHQWVCDNIERRDSELKGAYAALKDKNGDQEDIVSLFIAVCRAADVPARTVWIPEECYAEFYLEDDKGDGHWLPCRLTGAKEFGGINETQPILQKGDNFKVPEEKGPVRFVPEFLKGSGGRPNVEFVRSSLGAS